MAQLIRDPMPTHEESGFQWILEHLLAYPGTYEIPLRTMYTLNSASQIPTRHSPSSQVMGNAFPSARGKQEASNVATATAAAQLKANLMTHISQQPAQPTSLPPSFVTNFVRRVFTLDLAQVDFPQALTAMDYLKDLETRRRNEFLAALSKLNVDRNDIASRDAIAQKYPRVLGWIDQQVEQERRVEALYTHVYLGLRRWALINEMSLEPFDKNSCVAMLNTLYPPTGLATSQFTPPTAQLTANILSEQRKGFFRYITAVERNGRGVLSSLMRQHRRPNEENGWPKVREDLDNYLRVANQFLDECLDVSGPGLSPQSIQSPNFETDEDQKRKIDSGISFGSGYSSNRSSGQSNATRPSTSSSVSAHSRHASRDKPLEKHLNPTAEEDETLTVKPAGSTLERIARELRKIGSRPNIREDAKSRPTTPQPGHDAPMDTESPPPTPGRGLRLRRSLKNMRSSSRARSGSTSRPVSRQGSVSHADGVPTFDPEQMKAQRAAWEAQQQLQKY